MERRACGIMLYAIMGAREYLSSGGLRELFYIKFEPLGKFCGAEGLRNYLILNSGC